MITDEVYEASSTKRVRFTNDQLAALDTAIITAVEQDNPITLRGIFYRVVSAGAADKTEASYLRIMRRLIKLRRDGLVPWGHVTDGTRFITTWRTWSDVDSMLENAARTYRRALWDNQPDEVYIFTEKDAIAGVLRPVVSKWDVPLGVLRGYSSETFAYEVAESIIETNNERSGTTYIYQLGDHDPSGVDAWRNFEEKVTGFITEDYEHADYIHFERLAVTEDQIVEMDLPTRPTKKKDTRSKSFDGGSVEVDAIPPHILRDLVREAIERHVDQDQYEIVKMAEREEREGLRQLQGLV